jgi:hypothetical protein
MTDLNALSIWSVQCCCKPYKTVVYYNNLVLINDPGLAWTLKLPNEQ